VSFETSAGPVVHGLARPVEFLGVLSTVQGVGAVVAGVTTTVMVRRLGELRIVWLGLATAAVGLLFVAGYRLPPVVLGWFAIGAVLVGVVAYRVPLLVMAAGVAVSAVYAFVTLREPAPPELLRVPRPVAPDAAPE
jgi:hypothetical protein